MLVLSLALVAIHAAFSIQQYLNLTNKFARDRSAVHQRNVLAVQGLIKQSGQRLQQMAEMVPSLFGMGLPLAKQDPAGIERAFESHWSALQLDMNIETIAFFDPQLRPLSFWGNGTELFKPGDPLLDAVRRVSESETPITRLDCRPECTQFAIVPVLVEGVKSGAIVLGVSLADVVVNFSQVSATDIGLIAPSRSPASARRLGAWDIDVVALTRARETMDVLRQAAGLRPLGAVLELGVEVEHGRRVHEVRLVALGSDGETPGYLVIVNDITGALAEIRGSTRNTIAAGLASLLLSELILLLLLWTPLSRLRRTALALPMLARSAFDSARAIIGNGSARSRYDDEIDLLDESAVALSHQLEALEGEVAERTKALSVKMQELTRERDFIRGLLDTAQVIIINQDRQGRVLLLNKHGEQLTKYRLEDLRGRHFMELIDLQLLAPDLRRQLEEVGRGQRRHLQHESALRCRDGTTRIVTWLHSYLEGAGVHDAAVLSVGLDVTTQKEAESRLSWLANHDPLTGLYNRRRFQEEFEYIVRQAQRYQRSGALLFLDLDHFKYVNDTSGHQAGDALIKSVAHELTRILRVTDVVARLGGDEFAVVVPEMDAEGACTLAQKLNDQLNMLVSPALSTKQSVSISIGIAIFPEHGLTATELLANADIAMYQAKAHGRGSWHLFSREEQVREKIERHVYWRQRIERALHEDAFVLHFQPIVDLRNGQAAHFEVLLRLCDEEGNVVLPPPVIETAEQTGLIHAIDHWVVRNAIESLERLVRHGRRASFAINLSAHAFMDRGLVPLLKDLFGRSTIDPGQLIFEITETAALQDFATAQSMMRSIREMGCKFALDDFGVGFSSLYYLKELPVDYVKIDGSFIQNLPDNENDQILVKAMSEIARGFGKKTVAEFVGDDETIALLRRYGVDFAQGFHVGRPAAMDTYFQECTEFLGPRGEGAAVSL